jgi:membrane protein
MLLLLVALTLLVQGRLIENGPTLTQLVEQFLPPHAGLQGRDPFALLERILRGVSQNRGELTLFTVPIFLWFSTRFFASVRTSLNHIFDVGVRPLRHRGIISTILVAKSRDVAMVMATLALFLVNTLITALFGIVRALGEDTFPDASFLLSSVGGWVAQLLAFLFGVSLFYLLYRFAAQRALGWRPALVASVFTAVAFEVAKSLYGFYLIHFATPDRFSVGFNIGAGVLFVLWAYYTALVFLLGAVVAQTWSLREMQRRQRAELR